MEIIQNHDIELTDAESKAIKSLERLSKKWPDTLILFSWSGALEIIKRQDEKFYRITHISGIPNEGGDPDSI
jgi:hypothetical protein